MQKDEKMVDVTIAAGGKIFKAHKLVRGDFFQTKIELFFSKNEDFFEKRFY